jgi:hypothetical protein
MKIVPIALCLIAASVPAQLNAQDTGLPADVTDLIVRRAGCDDWLARVKSDPALSDSVAPIFAALRCNGVPQDEAALRERYQGNSVVVSALNGKWTKFVTRVPVQLEQSPQE